MPPNDTAAAAATVPYLLGAISALSRIIGVLFYMLIKAKDDVTASKNEVIVATKEIVPATQSLLRAVNAIEKITERYDEPGHG